MVKKFLFIGYDFLCSWNVFITDCDWHYIGTKIKQIDTKIGDHVWITCNCSVLKGSDIGSNSILSNGTVVHREKFDDYSLISGNPARRIKNAPDWSR
jgi:acetyltransferase-like isoleucine patch superfamily enzyme